MEPIQSKQHKTCQYCEKILHGRSDQKFCNDTCRNTFNREKRAAEKVEENANTPEIFRIIKRNYQILKRKFPRALEPNEYYNPETEIFLSLGIDTRFCTSTFIDHEGKHWACVFEMCFCLGKAYCFVKDFPEQAQV